MYFSENATYNYASILRNIYCALEYRIRRKNKDLSEKDESLIFGIDPEFPSESLLSCIYLLEDTSQAIDNYYDFGLDRKGVAAKKIGEKYLRLYGLLNAVYMQFTLCRELYKMYKVPGLSDYVNKASSYRILKARHAGASHSVNYKLVGIKSYFRISQGTLSGFGENIHIISSDNADFRYNLKKDLKDFEKLINLELSKIIKFINRRMFDKNSKDFRIFESDLIMVDSQSTGEIVIENIGNGKFEIYANTFNE